MSYLQRKKEAQVLYKLQNLPKTFIILMTAIACIGFMVLYSASGGSFEPWAAAQMKKFALGFILMIIVAIIDIRIWFRFAFLAYLFGIVLLILVKVIGVEGGLGAQRWLNLGGFQFQPSELMKVFLVISLAKYFHNVHYNNINKLSVLFFPLITIGVAAWLILKQPNLGTATIVILVGAAMTFVAGVSWKKFAIAGVIVLAMMPLAWSQMRDYQKQRVHTFLSPESDPLGAGYNIIQSKIAIGSGGYFGKGFLNGTQGQLSFVPEKQTDFIFSIVAEEFGLFGGLFTMLLYASLIMSGIFIAMGSHSAFGALTAYGIVTILFVHVFINCGMVMGILPVVGVPLPLLSYGGSSIVSNLIGFGFVLNAHVHRKINFTD